MSTAAVNPDRMTRAEAAEYLSVHPQTLACWASTGRYGLPYVRVGAKVYYRKRDLDEWLASRTITHTGTLAAADAAAVGTSGK